MLSALLSPASHAASAARRAACSVGAYVRSAGVRYALRDESARPEDASRVVGTMCSRSGDGCERRRSRVSRRRRSACWMSFWPK
jgi:hypothetical protein